MDEQDEAAEDDSDATERADRIAELSTTLGEAQRQARRVALSGTGGRPPRVQPPRASPRGVAAHVACAPFGEHELVVVVLRYSRALWAQWVPRDAPTVAFCRCILRAAQRFGGSPRWWLFEEPDCRVLHWDGMREHFADPLEELAWHLSSGLGVWSGRDRGPAVAALEYLRGATASPSRRGRTTANAALRTLLAETAPRRSHPRQPGRSVAEVHAEERRHLHPLPAERDVLDAWLRDAQDDAAFDD